jgi:cob(I)alamin adenosyltransferase
MAIMKKFSIVTKKGDTGITDLLDGSKVGKDDSRLEICGTLDEAAAFLGLARAKTDWQETRDRIQLVQNHIYLINAELACPPEQINLLQRRLKPLHLTAVEEYARRIEAQIDLPRKFVLYGQTEISALIDIARTVVRRAERRLTQLARTEKISSEIIQPYINRLSDLLYLIAREEEFRRHIPFLHPE